MQPLDKKTGEAMTTAHLGSAAFAALAESSIAPENIFFHKFYQVSLCIPSPLIAVPVSSPMRCELAVCHMTAVAQPQRQIVMLSNTGYKYGPADSVCFL